MSLPVNTVTVVSASCVLLQPASNQCPNNRAVWPDHLRQSHPMDCHLQPYPIDCYPLDHRQAPQPVSPVLQNGQNMNPNVSTVTTAATVTYNAASGVHIDAAASNQSQEMTSVTPNQMSSTNQAMLYHHRMTHVMEDSSALYAPSSTESVSGPTQTCVGEHLNSYTGSVTPHACNQLDYDDSRYDTHLGCLAGYHTDHVQGDAGEFPGGHQKGETGQRDIGGSCMFVAQETLYPDDPYVWQELGSYPHGDRLVSLTNNEQTDTHMGVGHFQEAQGAAPGNWRLPEGTGGNDHNLRSYTQSSCFAPNDTQPICPTFEVLSTCSPLTPLCGSEHSHTLQASNPFHDDFEQPPKCYDTDISELNEQLQYPSCAILPTNKSQPTPTFVYQSQPAQLCQSRPMLVNHTQHEHNQGETVVSHQLEAEEMEHFLNDQHFKQFSNKPTNALAVITEQENETSAAVKHPQKCHEADRPEVGLQQDVSNDDTPASQALPTPPSGSALPTPQSQSLATLHFGQQALLPPKEQQLLSKVALSDPRLHNDNCGDSCAQLKHGPPQPSSGTATCSSSSKPDHLGHDYSYLAAGSGSLSSQAVSSHSAALGEDSKASAFFQSEGGQSPHPLSQYALVESPLASSDKCLGGEDDSSMSSSSNTSPIDVNYLLSSGVTVAGFKPRPIIRKRRKIVIPTTQKDTGYWRKRQKNNDSAKRSREAKKEKEKKFYRRALELEYENYFLKERLGQLEARLQAATGVTTTPHQYVLPPAPQNFGNTSHDVFL